MTYGKQLVIAGMMFCCLSIIGGRLHIGALNLAAGIVGYPLVIYGVVRMVWFERDQ